MAISHAYSNPSAIFNGCRPISNNLYAYSRSAPANTTTPVVPSPTSLSYDLLSSTNNLAAGCSISIRSTMVAPSLDTFTSPSGDTNILSNPFGPNDDLKVEATERAANMFDLIASTPFNLLLDAYSFTIM